MTSPVTDANQMSLKQMSLNDHDSKSELDCLPHDLILLIFQKIKDYQTFQSFALATKSFYKISQISEASLCLEFVPNYIAQTTDSAIRKLPTWKKLKLASKIAKRLASNDSLKVIYQKCSVKGKHLANLPSYPKLLIDHYFIVVNSLGWVKIVNLQSNQKIALHAHNSKIDACLAIQIPDPLFVTISLKEGFKIWSLKTIELAETECEAILHCQDKKIAKSHLYASKDPNLNPFLIKHPVINTYQHLLGVGYKNYVLIIDNKKLTTPAYSIHIKFIQVKQIVFTDEHVMLVSDHLLAIWNIATLTKAFTTQQEVDIESAMYIYQYEDRIFRFANIYKDLVVIAYAGQHFIVGEVRNYQTKEFLRKLIHPKEWHQGQLNTMDFHGHLLATGSRYTTLWDLTATTNSELANYINREECVHKVYLQNQHILFAKRNWLAIDNQQLSSTKMIRTASMNKFLPGTTQMSSFELNGKHLIVETHLLAPQNKRQRTITVYDLDPQKSSKTINTNKN